MRFRAKVFLAVLLPSSLLVAVAAGAALFEIDRSAGAAVRREFGLTRDRIEHLLDRRRADLEAFENTTFGGIYYKEFMAEGADPSKREGLRGELVAELESFNLELHFLGIGWKDAPAWFARYGHDCKETCSHRADSGWIARGAREALFRLDGEPALGRRIPFEESRGSIALGLKLADDLRNLPVDLALFHSGARVWVSREGWEPAQGQAGSLDLGGERHLAGSAAFAGDIGEMVWLRSMAEVDRQRRITLLAGSAGMGLAVLVAALVSLRVARGVSRPVELLVAGARKVGEGDYGVRVEIPGRDEMADLGRAFNGMTEGLRKRREIMEKTLSRDVAEELMKGVERGGERREVTVMFMDVRGFTSATEGVDPAEVVAMLNDMLDGLAEPVSRNGGNVNKYLGDGLMAMFGAPRELEDHAFRAASAALEMQRAMGDWNARRAGRGLAPLRIGIGINTGTALGGKVGSRERLEYTLIGEEVNLASRVCGKAAPGQVLVTKQTFDRLGGRLRARELEPVQVKGLSYPVQVYEVIG